MSIVLSNKDVLRATLLMIIRLEMPEKVKDFTLSSVTDFKFTHGSNTNSAAASIILKLLYKACLIIYKIGRPGTPIYL